MKNLKEWQLVIIGIVVYALFCYSVAVLVGLWGDMASKELATGILLGGSCGCGFGATIYFSIETYREMDDRPWLRAIVLGIYWTFGIIFLVLALFGLYQLLAGLLPFLPQGWLMS